MGTFKIQVPVRLMFTEVLSAGSRRLLAWNARSPRLSASMSSASTKSTASTNVGHTVGPNVIDGSHRFETRARDSVLVTEFKSRLRQTEDLIGKLGYSLRELYSDND